MLKNIKKVRKFRNIILVFIAIIMVLSVGVKIWYSNFEKVNIRTIAAQDFKQMKSSTSIGLGHGTIVPIYRPEWTKVGSTIDTTNKTITITVKGNASKNQTINSDVNVNYQSDVTGALSNSDIEVYVNGVLDGDINNNGVLDAGEASQIDIAVTKTVPTASSTGEEVQYEIELSDFEEAVRRTGKPFKDLSGNISIKILGRGEDQETYDADVLVDEYTNQSMMELDDSTGTWIDIKYEDSEIMQNTNGTMFTDFVKPEFTYKSSDTTIGSGTSGDKKVKIEFDITDQYFNVTTLLNSDITVKLIDENVTIPEANITKTLTKTGVYVMNKSTKAVTLKAANYTIPSTEQKVGERYELVIEGLEQKDANGFGDGYVYSGPMSLTFPSGKVTDLSNNSNDTWTITLGINEEDGNPETNESGTQEIVDVVDPIWTLVGTDLNTGLIKLRVKDKYYDSCTINANDHITVIVNGSPSTSITKTIIAGPIEVVAGEEYEYHLQLSNITLADGGYVEFTPTEPIVGGTAKYKAENGGQVSIKIAAGIAKDESGNGNKETTFDVGIMDATNPEVYQIQATNNADKTTTIIFNVTDRNYVSTDKVTIDELTVLVDGTEVEGLIKDATALTSIEIKGEIDGTTRILGHQYTLVLSEFIETQAELVATGREYRELSGTVEVKIDEDASKDINANTLNPDTTTLSTFVDFIKPEITYRYTVSSQGTPGSIDYGGKTFTMVFDIIDKYYSASTLTNVEQLVIKIDGEVPDWTKVGRNLTVTDIQAETAFKKTVSGSLVSGKHVIGQRYTLELTNLEQLEILSGDQYADYSGVISVVVPSTGTVKVTDTSNNVNTEKTITSGIDIFADVQSGNSSQIVDVVDSIWTKVSSSANSINQTATITVRGTDKYYSSSDLESYLEVYVDGSKVTGSPVTIDVSDATPVYKDGTTTQIGDDYTVTITGFAQDSKQVKIKILEGAMTDTSGNTNKDTEMILYNVLKATSSETAATSKFLGSTDTTLQRQNIENVTFTQMTQKQMTQWATLIATDNSYWDVSAQGDKSIIAHYTDTNSNGAYEVTIASHWEMFANKNSSYLFSYIGYAEVCASANAVMSLSLLNTNSVVKMSHMFQYFGYDAMTSLTLPSTFDTSNVTDMSSMFRECGYTAMTSLTLPEAFDTSSVEDMNSMFQKCGYTAMTSLTLPSSFDTSSVTNMSSMFNSCGYTLMKTLNLGANFNTSSVTNMSSMFNRTGYGKMTNIYFGDSTGVTEGQIIFPDNFNTSSVTNMSNMFNGCGYTAMTSLTLPSAFNTSSVTNMYKMFTETGYKLMTSLNLGDNFDTSQVTDMRYMFQFCGNDSLTSLDLGDKFNTNAVTDMTQMFRDCGTRAMTSLDLGPAFTKIADTNTGMFTSTGKSTGFTIYAPESIYKTKNAFKLSTTDTTNSISYTRGTINPIYKPKWEKLSSTINTTDKTISVNIKGYANETFTNGTYTGTYSSEVASTLLTGQLTPAQVKQLLNIYIDGELDGDADNDGALGESELPSITVTITLDEANSTATEKYYTIKLSGFEESIRQSGKNFKEWSGNISIQPLHGTLVDKYGSYLSTDGGGNTVTNTGVFTDEDGNYIGNKNMEKIDLTEGVWTKVELKDETNITSNTNGKMFTDYIKPEFTYESSNTNIDYDHKTVTVVFDVTDKYFKETSLATDTNGSLIKVVVDETDIPASVTLGKTVTKLGDFILNTETGAITYATGTYTLSSTERKVGERYQLLVSGLETSDGEGYSGPMSIVLDDSIIEDLSGNKNDEKTITIGVDEPGGDPTDEDIVDVVNPVWKGVIDGNQIYRKRDDSTNNTDTVDIVILGRDKYYYANTLAEDKIKVYVDDILDGDADLSGTLDEGETITITKQLNKITDPAVLEAYAEQAGLDYVEVGYILTLSTFGELNGKTKIVIDAGTIRDTSGNVNLPTTITAGNTAWVEDTETDPNYPRYPAFRQNIVDFIYPKITYQYSAVDGSKNPVIDYEDTDEDGDGRSLTVKFQVYDKYLVESTIINADGTLNKTNVRIKVGGTDITDDLVTTITAEEIKETVNGVANVITGYNYTLVVENFELLHNGSYVDYSGVVQLVFSANTIDDLSGNGNVATTITLDTDDGDDPDDGIIVDVIDPLIEKVGELSLINASNEIARNPVTGTKIENATTDESELGTGTVTVWVKATDKYLSGGTLGNNDITVKLMKPDGVTEVTLDSVQKVVTKESQDGTSIVYKIVLSNFEANEGVARIIIPADKITDTSNNGNQETSILVGNSTWTETGDNAATPKYPAFRNSIIDLTRPKWDWVTSSITRNRDGETGTVTIKLRGTDTYYLEDTLDENDISIYVANAANPTEPITTITKDLSDPTLLKETRKVNGVDQEVTYGVEYTLTLENFETYDGQVKIKIAGNTIMDTSGQGNRETEILIGNPEWVETDLSDNADSPKYTAFRNSVVDFIKPVVTYTYETGVNPILDHDNDKKEVKITFNVTDTNFLESNIDLEEDIQIFIDTGTLETDVTDELTKSLDSQSMDNGISYTLTLSQFELEEILANEEYKKYSGIIKLVIAGGKVEDTSGNKNIETTIIIDNDDGDDLANGIEVDFINPKIYFVDKFISWDQRYATVTLRGTDRFYDFNTELDPEDITLYELKNPETNEWIDITSISQDDISITPVETEYGYDFVIRLDNFEEEFKMKIKIAGGQIADTLLGPEDIVRYNDETEILVDLDNKKPVWKYISTDTSQFEITEGSEETVEGTIKFTVRGQDKYLKLDESGLTIDDPDVDPEVRVLRDGVDVTNYDNITINYLGSEDTLTRKSKTYEIVVEGLTEIGTYSLVFDEGTLKDDFNNVNATTTISFSKSAIASNTDNYTNITYHATPDYEIVHSAYVHELMSVNENGTNYESESYRPSSIGEIHNDGENTLFAEPFEYAEGVQEAESFKGWAEADENGNIIYYTDSSYGTVSATKTAYYKLFGLYDEIPNTITNLKAVWQEATVIFVSSDESKASNSNDGLSPDTPVLDIETAYNKLSSSRTMDTNIIVIMDAVTWGGTTTLSKNATITSLYAGVDYRLTGAELKITKNFVTNKDVQFDNIKLYADSTTISDGSNYLAKGTYTNMLITNYGDVILGRRITTPTDKYTFGAVVGGNFDAETTTGTIGRHKVIVEAGKYNNIVVGSTLNSQSTATKYVRHEVVIGNMKDAAVSRNDKLTITGYLSMGEVEDRNYAYNPDGSQSTSSNYSLTYADVTLLSGTFTGAKKFTKSSENAAIYLRPLDGYSDGKVDFKMYGGNVNANMYAGSRYPTDNSTATVNIMKFYGGQVNANIFGHGNNITSTGCSEITLEGIIAITGNVFGGSNAGTIGTGKITGNTKITVNSGTLTGNIYGGSNGIISGTTVDLNNGYITGNTNVILNAGTITGDIYGSGYNCGNSATANITINNGSVTGGIYGGAYQNQVRTTSNITILGGTVKDVFGGSLQTASTQQSTDTNQQTVNIVIGDTTLETAPTISGAIYGGGKYDKVGIATIQLIKAANAVTVYGGSQNIGYVETVNIYLRGITANEIYGGPQTAGTVGTSNIYLETGTATDIFGGGFGGTTSTSNIILEGTATVTSIYGGSSTSGTVTTSNVTLKSGTVTNVFGGGNSAPVGTANVTLDGITINTIHGGSKDAGITTNTNVILKTGTVTNVFGGGLDVGVTTSKVTQQGASVTNIYGGNNAGTGDGGSTTTTNVNIVNSTVQNVYGGNRGRGTSRYTNINIQGTAIVTGKLYGGGYQSNIGKSGETGSTTINISGGTINSNINGGSENAVVYGTTNINIGRDAIAQTMATGNITIGGTIFGAGDSSKAANRDRQRNYDYNYVSVYGNTNIKLYNGDQSPITFHGSIYGAGNAATYSNATDTSTIHIKNFGTQSNAYKFESIERTGDVYIGNSFIELMGRQDVNNYYKNISYTINKVTNALTIYNNTTIHTRRGFNQVGGFNSLETFGGDKATAVIDAGTVTRNVDNRIYTLEGVNLIFAKQEGNIYADTTQDIWGDVNGMTFFGMYTLNRTNGNKIYDIYAPNFSGNAVENFFANGTFIEGRHKANHDTAVDGFYTNIGIYGDTVTVEPQYVLTTDYGTYYDWIAGADIVNYQTTLIGSVYGNEAIADLVLDYKYGPEATYTLNRVSLNALDTNVQLVDPLLIPMISANANNTFGLTVETIKSGWYNSVETNIYTANDGSYSGDTTYNTYKTDNTTDPGTIRFRLTNSVNITEHKDLGYVNLILTGKTKANADGSVGNTFIVVIAVNIQTRVDDEKEQYEPRFTDLIDTHLNYTTDSRVDLTYTLYKTGLEELGTPYETGDYRVLSSTVQLPVGTKLTMKDDVTGNTYYHHVTASTPYTTETKDDVTRYIYRLSNFILMGSTNVADKYTDNNSIYYHDSYLLERYDISIDFIDSSMTQKLERETYLELRNAVGTIKYDNGNDVDGDTQITYSLYSGENVTKDLEISNAGQTYSVVTTREIPFTVDTSILEGETDSGETVMDTKYYDKIAGIAVDIKNGNERPKSPKLQNFRITNVDDPTEVYTADDTGVIRIPTTEGFTTRKSNYKLSLTQSNVPAGTYTITVYFFTSDDGEHHGGEATLSETFYVTFVNNTLGLVGVESTEESRIIDKTTGQNLEGNMGVDMTVKIGDPTDGTNLRVELYKRNPTYTVDAEAGTTTYNGTTYTLVDIKDYLQGTWKTPEDYEMTTTEGSIEYVISPKEAGVTTDLKTIEFEKALVEGIASGEYKLVFKSYYDDILVQTVRKTFIVTQE